MIVFGAGRTGRTFLGLFLPCPPQCQVSPFTSGGGGVIFHHTPGTYSATVTAVSAYPGGEGRRLSSAACGDLLHRWLLACSAVAVPTFS